MSGQRSTSAPATLPAGSGGLKRSVSPTAARLPRVSGFRPGVPARAYSSPQAVACRFQAKHPAAVRGVLPPSFRPRPAAPLFCSTRLSAKIMFSRTTTCSIRSLHVTSRDDPPVPSQGFPLSSPATRTHRLTHSFVFGPSRQVIAPPVLRPPLTSAGSIGPCSPAYQPCWPSRQTSPGENEHFPRTPATPTPPPFGQSRASPCIAGSPRRRCLPRGSCSSGRGFASGSLRIPRSPHTPLHSG